MHLVMLVFLVVWCALDKLVLVNFGRNALNGTLPPSIYKLKSIQSFYFNYNSLSGTIGEELLPNLKSVQNFYLYSNQV